MLNWNGPADDDNVTTAVHWISLDPLPNQSHSDFRSVASLDVMAVVEPKKYLLCSSGSSEQRAQQASVDFLERELEKAVA